MYSVILCRVSGWADSWNLALCSTEPSIQRGILSDRLGCATTGSDGSCPSLRLCPVRPKALCSCASTSYAFPGSVWDVLITSPVCVPALQRLFVSVLSCCYVMSSVNALRFSFFFVQSGTAGKMTVLPLLGNLFESIPTTIPVFV